VGRNVCAYEVNFSLPAGMSRVQKDDNSKTDAFVWFLLLVTHSTSVVLTVI